MIMEYINKNYSQGEPIFEKELPCSSKKYLIQEMKKLTDEGKLVRVYNGVYFKPYKTIFGTDGKMLINKYLEKKYILNQNEIKGYLCGIALYNKYGFTTQIPSTIEVTSNEATTKQRKLCVDDYDITVYKPLVKINKENVNELEFLSMMADLEKYSEVYGEELKFKVEDYIKIKKINFEIVKKYLPLFPDRIYKNLYNGGVMNELV